MELAPNVVVAERFRLNRLLGRGGMGSVWHCTHLGLDTPCAVKFIEGPGATQPDAHARFQREAKAAAQLRSPHVVQILDHGVWQSIPYIAMELLEGEDLGHRLRRVKRMAPAELVAIVAQIARALTKAHGAGIVHRDLKPENVFLVHDDDREIAKVLDFGIAKAPTMGVDSATKTGALMGTPYYMSPEQAQGTKAVDARSDLWSLAVIVFEGLTGVVPFQSEALGDLLIKIIVAPLPVPSHVAPEFPPELDRWWEKAASRDPGGRFQTAKELVEALSVALRVTGGPAYYSSAPSGAPDAALGHERTQLATSPSGVTPAPLGASLVSAQALTGPRETRRPPSRQGRTALAGGLLVVAAISAGVVALTRSRAPGPSAAAKPTGEGRAPTAPEAVGEARPVGALVGQADAATATPVGATEAAPDAGVAHREPRHPPPRAPSPATGKPPPRTPSPATGKPPPPPEDLGF